MSGSRARRIGVAIGLAAVAAVVAVVALGSDDDGSSEKPDRATIIANRLCKTARLEAAQAMRKHSDAFERGNPGPLGEALFPVFGVLQEELGELEVPQGKLEPAVELKERVLEAEQDVIVGLIFDPSRKELLADAKKLEAIDLEVESIASELGYEECARLDWTLPPNP